MSAQPHPLPPDCPVPDRPADPAAGAPTALPRLIEEKTRIEDELDLRNCALDALAACLAMIDVRQPERPYVFLNQAFASLYEQPRERLIGRSCDSLPVVTSALPRQEELKAAMLEGRELRTELELRRPDGGTFWFGLNLTPVRDPQGRLTHCVVIGADITARLEAERRKHELQERLLAEMKERERMALELRLAQKLESVGRLAAGVAHEINTPIQYVGDSVYFLRTAMDDLQDLLQRYRNAVDALGKGMPPEPIAASLREAEAQADMEFIAGEVPRAFERTLEGVDRVASIVRAMKEFAHPDPSEQSPADLNHALETTLTVARNEYKYIAEVELDLQPLPPVMCNIGELNQVFLNLIVNAAHAIEDAARPPGQGRIRVTSREEGEEVLIAISDNGCGIPPQYLEHIFDPFFTTKEVGKGTGQGLAIARSIVVDRHAGHIDVHSTPGEGTEFVIRLPSAGRGQPGTTE